ncbi:MAG: deoxyguanosinetriphosphate triphosphohydrolase [Streptosporangiaceae bacterium]|nr:deoxyguanosinetriphosphate triphosphohydrolase [Streptosporangiaceae bacterium]
MALCDTTYDACDRERWALESPKRRGRSEFERDRARVLHSPALRRLAVKTQVTDPYDGSSRNRLTHSLECAQVGRELGKAFGSDPDLVETACLAHDLGHPPFGHNGEATLDAIAAKCGGFEANAQSLRILTRLESKSFAPDGPPLHGRSVGLNLTRAALDAVMKYPWPRAAGAGEVGAGRSRSTAVRNVGKFGVYEDEAGVAAWVRKGVPEMRPCFEAQVMDWADDVVYSVHDLEDAVIAGHVKFYQLTDPTDLRAVCSYAAKWYCDAESAELEDRLHALHAEPFWPADFDGTQRALAALKNLTSELIGRFCRAAERATRYEYGPDPLTRYAADLIVPREERLECALLKGVAAHHVMGRASHGQTQAREREVIIGLADRLSTTAPDSLEPVFREMYLSAASDTARLRVIVDQVASLTNASAMAWHIATSAR